MRHPTSDTSNRCTPGASSQAARSKAIDEFVDENDFDRLALDAFRGGDGLLYGVPRDMQTVVLLYDSEILAAHGFDAPPDDWDALADVSGAISDGGEAVGLALTAEPWNWLPFLYQSGGELVTDGRAQLDSEQAQLALDYYVELVRTGSAIVPPAGLAPSDEYFPYGAHDEAVRLLADGQVAMILAPNNVLELAIKENRGSILAAATPSGPAGRATIAYVTGLGAYTELTPGSASFIQQGTSPAAQNIWAESVQFMPTRPALYDDYLALHPEAAAFVDAIGYARQWQPPSATFEQLQEFDRSAREPLAAALRGEVSTGEALARMQALANEFLLG